MNYYSIGADRWSVSDYPTENNKTKKLYFSGDNSLGEKEGEGKFTYRYDPEQRLNVFKYRNVYRAEKANSNDGIISFESDEFKEDTSFFGKIRWHMNVSSDCEDSAFFMRVYLVEGDEAYNITETITSINHIDKSYKPNEKLLIDIKTPPVGFTVKKGNKIRVDIASDGGVYVPNANIKGHWAQITETKVANNTIYCEGAYIQLPCENTTKKY